MNDEINVGIADMKITTVPNTLISYALGSCVGICIMDKVANSIGMVHIMLPTSSTYSDANLYKYADTGIPEMVRKMEQMGCKRARMTAKIAGGAKMFDIKGNSSIGNIGERNVEAVKQTLEKLRIRLIGQDVGENYGRTITFDSSTGNLTIKTFANKNKII